MTFSCFLFCLELPGHEAEVKETIAAAVSELTTLVADATLSATQKLEATLSTSRSATDYNSDPEYHSESEHI